MFTTCLVFWPMTLPSGLSMGVCCLTGGPFDTRPTLFLAVLALIWGRTTSAPGKSLVWRRRFPWCQTKTTGLTDWLLISDNKQQVILRIFFPSFGSFDVNNRVNNSQQSDQLQQSLKITESSRMLLHCLKHHYKMILVLVGVLITNVFAFSQACSQV